MHSHHGRKAEEAPQGRNHHHRSNSRGNGGQGYHSRRLKTVVEVMLSFDTTGSMYKYLDAVRASLSSALTELKAAADRESVVLRVGVVAHGDYCDKATAYVIKFLPLLDLTPANEAKIQDFIAGVGRTSGGDAPECYELALNKVRKGAHWTRGSRRALVLVGDANPHDVGYSINGYTNHIDWKHEAEHLARMGVRVYAVHAGGHASSRPFYDTLATTTQGARLDMKELGTVSGLVVAATMNEVGGEALSRYSHRLREQGRMSAELEVVIQRISTVTRDKSGVVSRRTSTKVTVVGGEGLGAPGLASAMRGLRLDGAGSAAVAKALSDVAPKTRAKAACYFFNRPSGCRKSASQCAFAHVKVCRYFNSPSGCSKSSCRFPHEAVSKPAPRHPHHAHHAYRHHKHAA